MAAAPSVRRTTTNAPARHRQLKVGLANLFLQHTSAALTLNENCDPDVRKDMKAALERLAPRGGGAVKYKHDCEG